MRKLMVVVANVVGSGALYTELDLGAVSAELSDIVRYDPDVYPGAYLRFASSSPHITIYRTGKYIITGGKSESHVQDTRSEFLTTLNEHNIIDERGDKWFSIQNVVCTGDLQHSLNLEMLTIGLGLERTEYEPEQFPGLIYRPPDTTAVILLFASGKVVLTGYLSVEEAEEAFDDVHSSIRNLLAKE